MADAVASAKLLQALCHSNALQELIAAEIPPALSRLDDAALLADFRQRSATVYHPIGTCRMGTVRAYQAGEAVVDDELRVHGVERLRVVDASVFPSITSGNTYSPTVMVALKAAHMMLTKPCT